MPREFIPATMARPIGDGVFFRPVKSWHSNTYAGERMTIFRGDGSGCMFPEKFRGLKVCSIPLSVTHRLYWHERDPKKTVSAFLSYPDGMGCSEEYFWEAYGIDETDDTPRYFGDNAEADLEAAVKAYFSALVETSN